MVMIFLGGVLGFPAGAALSWLATAASSLIAFAVGRRMGRRARPPRGLEQRLVSHGVLVVALTRPVPVLAETTAVAAGMVPAITWRRMTIGAVAGTAPPAVLFAAAGAYARGTSGVLLVAACLLLDIVVWQAERLHRRRAGAFGLCRYQGRDHCPDANSSYRTCPQGRADQRDRARLGGRRKSQ